jgi:hypothetical protein
MRFCSVNSIFMSAQNSVITLAASYTGLTMIRVEGAVLKDNSPRTNLLHKVQNLSQVCRAVYTPPLYMICCSEHSCKLCSGHAIPIWPISRIPSSII